MAPSPNQDVTNMRLRTSLVTKLALITGAALVSLVGMSVMGESLVRYRERNRTTVPGTMPLIFYQHDRHRQALTLGYDYFGWISINGQGFRGTRDYGPNTPDKIRIMVMGGSTTFDSFVTGDDRAWPVQLEKSLEELAQTCSFEIINAGVPGYQVLDNLIRLQTELFQYDPDLIVLYQTHNDLFRTMRGYVSYGQTTPSNRPGQIPTVSWIGRWLGQHSLLYAKLRLRLKTISRNWANRKKQERRVMLTDLNEPFFLEGAERFERDLRGFLAIASAHGFPVVVPQAAYISGAGTLVESDSIIRWMLHSGMPFAEPDAVVQGYARFSDIAKTVAAANYVPTADFGLRGPKWYSPGDMMHFNDAGAERMGRMMGAALLKNGAIDRDACVVRVPVG